MLSNAVTPGPMAIGVVQSSFVGGGTLTDAVSLKKPQLPRPLSLTRTKTTWPGFTSKLVHELDAPHGPPPQLSLHAAPTASAHEVWIESAVSMPDGPQVFTDRSRTPAFVLVYVYQTSREPSPPGSQPA